MAHPADTERPHYWFGPADLSTRPYRCPRDTTCPSPGPHDDLNGYNRGCRSQLATIARSDRHREWAAGERPTFVDAAGSVRRLRALVILGYTLTELGRRMYVSGQYLHKIADATYPKLHEYTAARIDEQWVLLSETDPEDTGHRRRARRAGQAKGWQPVAAWDATDIDDPNAQAWGSRSWKEIGDLVLRERRTEVRRRVVEATRAGESAEVIGQRLGITSRAVQRWRTTARELGELPPLRPAVRVLEGAA